MPKVSIGDRVAYSRAFLASTGQRGNKDRGEVVGFSGSFPTVCWNGDYTHNVNQANLRVLKRAKPLPKKPASEHFLDTLKESGVAHGSLLCDLLCSAGKSPDLAEDILKRLLRDGVAVRVHWAPTTSQAAFFFSYGIGSSYKKNRKQREALAVQDMDKAQDRHGEDRPSGDYFSYPRVQWTFKYIGE